MTIEIDVTLKHTGPSPAIRLKTPPPIATTRNVDMQSYRVPAGNRVAQDLASKLALLKAENLAIIAERSRLIAEREREAQLADRGAERAATERSHLIAERDRDAQLAAAQNAALVSRIKDLEDHNRLLTKTATESARQLQERTQTDYQILMAQQQLLAGMKDADPAFHDIYERCKDYTMTSVERLYALYKSVEYIVRAGLGGDFVETGVWRGGSCMLIAETLIALDDTSRRIFLFDTFEGHPKPDAEKDVDIWGNRAIEEWDRRMTEAQSWADVSIDEARANMARTGYPANRIFFVKGMVEETVPRAGEIGDLALLRLDTDWYDSARVSLECLFPRLVEGGVLIMDDYGHYKGQQQALDEYLAAEKQHLLLNRIDYSCRVAVKGRTGSPNANTPD